MEQKSFFVRWRANFLTGLAVVLPAIVSIALIVWLFGTVSNVTDTLLFFVPRRFTHQDQGAGPTHWYWSLAAFVLAITLITLVGVVARYYVGKRMIEWVDNVMLRIPFLNKIYSATKQVNEAFTSGKKESFKTVVLIEFPHKGTYSVGFITSEQHDEAQQKIGTKVVCVFIPTTPNPTSGFLVLVPEQDVIKLEMSVTDGFKYIISLGAIAPEYRPHAKVPLPSVPVLPP